MEMQKNTQPQQPEDLTPKIYYMTKDDLLPENISYVGRKMRLKEFHDWFDCEVEFTDDGYVAEHVVYGCYHFGNVKHPRDYFRYKYAGIGQRCTVRGRNVCIVDGKHTNDVTFMFDDGKIITHKPAKELHRGCFGDINRKSPLEYGKFQRCIVGEKFTNKVDDVATITKIWPVKSSGPQTTCYVDVAFEHDGRTIPVQHVNYYEVMQGNVMCPTEEEERAAASLRDTLPMSRMTADGHLYEVERINGLKLDVLVDKVLVKDVPFQDYLNDRIALHRFWELAHAHIGETCVNVRGQTMEIIAWRGCKDIEVMINGEIATHRDISCFRCRRMISDRAQDEIKRKSAERRAAKHKTNIPPEQAV